jgi:dienelactone hydrolase
MMFRVSIALLASSLAAAGSQDSLNGGGSLRGNAASRADVDQDSVQLADLPEMPNLTCSYVPNPTDCREAENITIVDEEAMIFNSKADSIVLLLHGWDLTCVTRAEDYCDLAKAISALGYCVVVPRGNSGPPTFGQVEQENEWAINRALAVHSYFPTGSNIAIVGHSLGGGGVLRVAESRRVPQFKAYVVMHPAIVAPPIPLINQARGPILFTMGTNDTTYSPFVTQTGIELAYKVASTPKAYVNVKGNTHIAPAVAPNFGGYEFTAMKTWLSCFITQDEPEPEACASFDADVCNAGGDDLENCMSAL